VRENGEYEGFRGTTNGVINALASPLGKSPGGLFIEAVRGSDKNVRTASLTAPFTLSTQS
jgi:hypothetical protein